MNNNSNEIKSGISWGGLGKDILAGAAIVTGLLIVFPGLGAGLMAAAGAAGLALGAATENVASGGMPEGVGTLLTKAFGAALAYFGATHFMKKGDSPELSSQQESAESFTAREDIRKMQALMTARMQAQGYQPAMAPVQAR
jgi:hypothetical protein